MKKPPCEWKVKELVPLLRAVLAYIMIRERGMSIYQTSKVLGVTPAAISNYLSAKRSKIELVNEFISNEELHSEFSKWVEKLLAEEIEAGEVLCLLCRKVTKWKGFCIDAGELSINDSA
ncbi:MAG: hypothetical protein B6U73_00745 [Desulfurococcales archaeon ex4484_204]|nr:MAG: hypothetical protein B6U73_00745 [Desulfurococcales archaeon ex4484_204]RLG80255.1 MAG: hypothetical protein DRO09_03360 [Thermoprotei archaeon]